MTDEQLPLLPGLTLDRALQATAEMIEHVFAEYSPVATLGLYSGGNDSTTLIHVVKDRLDAAVHINTGIGIEETRQFVRDTCGGWNLPLIEEHPPAGSTYDDLVIRYGFPGPMAHSRMYANLKERGLRAVRRRYITNPRSQRIVYFTGIRSSESRRRFQNAEPYHREGSVVWCAPLVHWTDAHMTEYRQRHDFPRNEVNANLHMSGECLCGAYAKPGELDMIAFFYPETARRIRDLEGRAWEAGQTRCKWGERPPKANTPPVGPLCSQCTIWTDEEVA